MEFNSLEDATIHAKTYNQYVKKVGNIWVTEDKVIILKDKVIADLEIAIENQTDEIEKEKMIAELKWLRNERTTTLSIKETGKIISV